MSIIHRLTDFFNEEKCQEYIHELRWKEKPLQCPNCQSMNIGPWGKYHRKPRLYRYHCKGCRRTFNDLTGTLLDRSRLPLAAWILAAFLMALYVSSRRISRELAVHIRTGYRWAWALRNIALSYERSRQLEGTIEADEIYQTAGCKGQTASPGGAKSMDRPARSRGKKQGPGRGHYDKDAPAIIAWVARSGQAVLHVVKDFSAQTVQMAALGAVRVGSCIYTDSAKSYRTLAQCGFLQEWVNHSKGEYVRGDIHENRGENIFSLLRPYLAVFRGLSKDNLPAYVGFYQFLFNHRYLTGWQQAEKILEGALDPKIAQAAKRGEYAQHVKRFLVLQTMTN